MSNLETYRQKRNFSITSEPPPKRVKKREGFSFCVQKHDATRLHYDFRLELDGVLKSWAVTRGPSLNPADKRLAVRTEDHPLAYGDFEGIIPQGEYGGGTVMLWDEGTWEPIGDPYEGIKKGHMKFKLQGSRMQGGWALVRMHTKDDKHENWLLIKEKDEAAKTGRVAEQFLDKNASSVKTSRSMEEIAEGGTAWKNGKAQKTAKKSSAKALKPAARKKAAKKPRKGAGLDRLAALYPEVQLATLVDGLPTGKEWIHEIKFDGYRLLCFVSGGKARLISRNGKDWTDKFPTIVQGLEALEIADGVFDGEAVIMDDKGRSSFQSLQTAIGDPSRSGGIVIYLFDILYLDGEDLSQLPLLERKERLKALLGDRGDEGAIRYSEHLAENEATLSKACKLGLEGLISKDRDAPYMPGRSKVWLKSKCTRRQEFIILGYTGPKSGDRALGALHVGYRDKGKLRYAAKVGTGFDYALAEKMLKMLKPIVVDKPPVDAPRDVMREAIWVEPKYLCEVSFTEWTDTGSLRHPSFEGLRQDKAAEEVTREKPEAVKKAVTAEKRERKKAAPATKKPAAKTAPKKAQKKAPQKTRGAQQMSEDGKLLGITITHPEREIFEGVGVTKQDLVEYYATVAPAMLLQMKSHPISLLRCPGGADKQCFFQRNPDAHMKKYVKPFKLPHNGKPHEYLYVENEEGIVFLAQMGVIEIHPWSEDVGDIEHPHYMIFDLDPAEDVPFEAVKLAAQDIRQRLKKLGLESFVKCTGGKGLHVTVPLDGKSDWEQVYAFTAAFSQGMAREVPDAYIATMSKEKRRGKIFIDYFRNNYASSAIADYAVRARPGAPVAVPIEWRELTALKSGNAFTLDEAMKRALKADKKHPRYTLKQKLPKI